MENEIRKEKGKIVWRILALVCILATILFSVLFGTALHSRKQTGEFPVDVSAYAVSKVCENDGTYVVGTQDGFIYTYASEDTTAPDWTFEKKAEGDASSPNPSVVDIAIHNGSVYVVYSDRYVYAFSLTGGETVMPEKTYRVGLEPKSIHFGTDEENTFAVYGDANGRSGLFIFNAAEESNSVIHYADHFYLDNYYNGQLTAGLTGVVIDGENTLYATTTDAKIVKITLGASVAAGARVDTAYASMTDFVAILKTDDGYAAMDKFATVYRFDEQMAYDSTVESEEAVSVTTAFASGDVFVAKLKNGGIVGLAADRGKVFSIDTSTEALIIFVSADGFVYLTADGGEFVYMPTAQAIAKERAEKSWWIYLALMLIFLLAAVYTTLGCFVKTRETVNGALKKFGKTAYKHKIAYLSLIPTFFLLAIFYWYPIVSSLVLAFFDYLPGERMNFVGMENLVSVFRNLEFWSSFKNTLIFLVSDLAKAIIPPILFAELLLSLKSSRTSYLVRVLMFLPGVIPGVAGMLVWADGIYGASSSGLLNGFLDLIVPSFASRAWLMDKSTALTCLIFIGFPWVGSYLIFFGAISGLPKEMFEAAKLDGCGWWRKMISFDMPLIVPQIKYTFITTFIGSVQNYTTIYVTTKGDYGTNTPALMLYDTIMTQKNYGIASAMGLILFIFMIGMTAINFKMQFGQSED